MWCSHCQQDVPGITASIGRRVVCSRCSRPMSTGQTAHAAAICDDGIPLDQPAAAHVVAAPPQLDDWHSRQHVRRLDRELRRAAVTPSQPSNHRPSPRRLDPPVNLFDDPFSVNLQSAATPLPAAAINRQSKRQVFAWLVVFTGAITLCGGIGLVAWSLAVNRADYWNLALGMTLGGQGVLIFGLVLVVARLWRNSRQVSGKLHEAHLRLGQLQRTADAIAGQRGGAPAFYADLARGSSPAMLVANLRGQVDQLATRLGG